MTSFLAIDPGDVHVGAAQFNDDDGNWRAIHWWTSEPVEMRAHLWEHGAMYDHVVIETFELFKNRALEQIGSKMRTARMIGAVEAIVVDHWGIDLIEQRPLIMSATAAQLKARKLPLPKRIGPHERSALLHGWHYALTEGAGFPATIQTERTTP